MSHGTCFACWCERAGVLNGQSLCSCHTAHVLLYMCVTASTLAEMTEQLHFAYTKTQHAFDECSARYAMLVCLPKVS